MSDEREESQEAEVPTEGDEAPSQEEPEPREISDGELQEILAEHQKWVESEEKAGIQADLSNVNLQEANLFEANLQKANLRGANLQKADLFETNLQEANLFEANLQKADLFETNLQEANLFEANLQEANLFGANLQKADLFETNFQKADLRGANLQQADLLGVELRETNLQDADLTGAAGLLVEQLAGANVSGAKLPEDIKEFKGLETTEEASRNARKIFQVMLLACAYSLLTIFSTKDPALLSNSSSSPLPIIQTGVPIAGFFVIAPIVLFAAYLYFHIYLQRLWDGLAGLPAIFPDGRHLDKRAYPWLLNGLVRSHFVRLKKSRPPHSGLQAILSILLAWCAVPVTIFLFWGRYIPRHDWSWTGSKTHIALLMVTVGFGLLSYLYARATLKGREMRRWKYRAIAVAVALGLGVPLHIFSVGAIEGAPFFTPSEYEDTDIRKWVPFVFEIIRWRTYADFADEDVSTKLENWTKEKNDLVKGARLKDRDLRYALAYDAFLVKADLRSADLQRARLWGANLQKANLRGADLQKAELLRANLREANLREANLQKADLQDANLQGANLRGAYLQGVKLRGADLYKANLQGAKLQGANLLEAKLMEANLKWAKLWGADLFLANLQKADLMEANLRGANLQKADLMEANLRGANLQKADLYKANLRGADLMGAGLWGAKNLTPSQVKSAKNWNLAFYDDDFLKKHGKELGLPQSEKEHTKNVKKKLAELEKKKKAGDGKK